MEKIRVIIADDHSLIVDGISVIINSQPDIEVIATADNGAKAVELVSLHRPDVVLMDIRMPGMTGIEALKEIKAKFPNTVVLMLTTFDPDEYIMGAFRNGADGYLLKDITGDKLILAIKDANAENITIPASIAARIIAHIPKEISRKSLVDYQLTQREIEIAELICKGYRNEQLSQKFGISIGTVKNYISSIYSKLEVSRRQEAIDLITGLNNQLSNETFPIF